MCIIFIKFGKETGGNSSLNKFILFWVLRRISISTGQFLTPRSFILGVRISGSSLRPVIMSVLNECRVVLCNHKWNVTQINCTQKIIVIHSILEWNIARFQLLMVCLSMTALHSAFTFFGGKAHLHGVICQHFVPSLFFLSVNSDLSRWWKGTALPNLVEAWTCIGGLQRLGEAPCFRRRFMAVWEGYMPFFSGNDWARKWAKGTWKS